MMDDTFRDAAPAATRVPTLTEVIDAADPSSWRTPPDRIEALAPMTVDASVTPHPSVTTGDTPADQDDRLRDAIAATLARFDATAEARLRDALQPILAEAAERLVAAARSELASSLRDLIAGAVAVDHTPRPDQRSTDPSSF